MYSGMNSGVYCAVFSLKYVVCSVHCAMYCAHVQCLVHGQFQRSVAMFSVQCTEIDSNIAKAKSQLYF